MRGGLTKGLLYIDEKFVYGKALIDAHNLEDQQAKYPRVIVNPVLVEDVNIQKFIKNNNFHYEILLQDEIDGKYFLNIFAPICGNYKWANGTNSCTEVYEIINYNLDHNQEESVKEKYLWLKNKLDKYSTSNFNAVS